MKFDKIDKELMAFLFEDGRATLTSLGERLGSVLVEKDKEKISHVAVQKRLAKMIENGLIKIQANMNLNQFNYVSAFILIETKEYDAQKRIIERFRLCPRVTSIDLVSGKYNLILRAVAPNMQELNCFLQYCWLKQEEGIRNMDIFISTSNVKPKFIPVPMMAVDEKHKIAPCGFRCMMCDLYKNKECAGCPATHFPETSIIEEDTPNDQITIPQSNT